MAVFARPGRKAPLLAALASAALVAAPGLGRSAPTSADSVSADPASADPVSKVVELFTSQGCPKCPPADRVVTDLARQPGLLALSYPVSTWDFEGWHDTLASPIFTRRQAAYAASRGDRLVFTPQAIVDGLKVEPGADRSAILHDLDDLAGSGGAHRVPLDIAETGSTLRVTLGAGTLPPAGVYVLRVAKARTVRIDRGANSGQNVTYTNVVRAMSRIGDWTGAPESFDLVDLRADDEGYVVLLQAGTPDKPGPILAAARTAGL